VLFSRSSLILALDIGATRTKALLTNLSGIGLATAEASGMNLRQTTQRQFQRIIDSLVSNLVGQSELTSSWFDVVAAGAAGAGSEKERNLLEDWIQQRWKGCLSLVSHDAFIAQYGAFESDPGVILIAGTGSIAYGRNAAGEEARAGGWGWMLGDEGSAWWIGREMIRETLNAAESGRETMMKQPLLEAFSINDTTDILGIIYDPLFDRKQISQLSERVTEAARSGDEIALSILYRAGEELGSLAIHTAKKLKIPPIELEVALLGGVAEGAGDLLRSGIEKRLLDYALEMPQTESDDRPQAIARLDPQEPGQPPSQSSEIMLAGKMAKYPPEDLTLQRDWGPRIIQPREDALHGAARWARNTILKRSFA